MKTKDSPDFEACFSNFLDRQEYDDAEAALFAMVRLAFTAGWRAAGGAVPRPQKVVGLLPPAKEGAPL